MVAYKISQVTQGSASNGKPYLKCKGFQIDNKCELSQEQQTFMIWGASSNMCMIGDVVYGDFRENKNSQYHNTAAEVESCKFVKMDEYQKIIGQHIIVNNNNVFAQVVQTKSNKSNYDFCCNNGTVVPNKAEIVPESDPMYNVAKSLVAHFKNPVLSKFFIDNVRVLSPHYKHYVAAKSHHHAYIGGLYQHVYEMLNSLLALVNTGMYESLYIDYVAIAVLFHDIAKIEEYVTNANGSTETTEYIKLVGHLYGSARIVDNLMSQVPDITQTDKVKTIHCILAHHGRKEWGAVVEPETAEAWMVHQLDMLSSKCAKNNLVPQAVITVAAPLPVATPVLVSSQVHTESSESAMGFFTNSNPVIPVIKDTEIAE